MHRRILGLGVLLALGMMLAAGTVTAQGVEFEVQDTVEIVVAEDDDSASKAFVLAAPSSLTNLSFSSGSLVDSGTKIPVPDAKVQFEPALVEELAANTEQMITITVSPLPPAGTYTVQIALAYDGQPDDSSDGITLQLVVQPRIKPPPAEVQLLLTEAEGGAGYVYRGRLAVTSASAGQITGLRLTNFSTLALKPASGPQQEVHDLTATPETGVTLAPGETKQFVIESPIPPVVGTYEGTCEILYDNRPAEGQYSVPLRLVAEEAVLEVKPTDKVLSFKPETAGGPYKATLTVTRIQGEISRFSFSPTDMTLDGGDDTIFRSQIAVTSPDLSAVVLNNDNPFAVFTLQISRPQSGAYEPGNYTGQMIMHYYGAGAEAQLESSETFSLSLNLEKPAISILPESKSLELTQAADDQPYKDSFIIDVTAGELSQIRFTPSNLYHNGDEGPIYANSVTVEPSTTDLTLLPEDEPATFVVQVSPPAGSNFETGTYTGSLSMSYKGGETVQHFDLVLVAGPKAQIQWKAAENQTEIAIKAQTSGREATQAVEVSLEETGELADARQVQVELENLHGITQAADQLPGTILTKVSSNGQEQPLTLPQGEAENLTLNFDFRHNDVKPGSYSGFLKVESENTDTLRVPVNMTVKARFWWALAFWLFFAGWGLSYVLRAYQSEYRERDILEEQINNLRPEFDEYKYPNRFKFYGRVVKIKLDAAWNLLNDKQWDKYLEQVKPLTAAVRQYQIVWSEHGAALLPQMMRLEALREKLGNPQLDTDCGDLDLRIWHSLAYRQKIADRLDEIEASYYTYDTGDKLKSDVSAELDRFNALYRAYHKYKWLESDRLPALTHDFPMALKRASERPVFQQRDKLITTLTEADITGAPGAIDGIEQKLYTTALLYADADWKRKELRQQLAKIEEELEATVYRGFVDRLAEQDEVLDEADADADLTAAIGKLDALASEVQAEYQAYRLFYFKRCQYVEKDKQTAVSVDDWIRAVDEANQDQERYHGWAAVKSKLAQLETQAKDLVSARESFDVASRLMHHRWRAVWFYHAALRPVYDVHFKDKQLHDAVKKSVHDAVEWLLSQDLAKLDLDDFDNKLKENLAKLFTDVSKAFQPPKPVQSPFLLIRPPKPAYRPLPDVEGKRVPPSLHYHAPGAMHLAGAESMATELGVKEALRPETRKAGEAAGVRAWLARAWKVVTGFFRRVYRWAFLDPRRRLQWFGLLVQATTFVVLLALAWQTWEQSTTFGSSVMDYFNMFFVGFAGTTAINTVYGVLSGWGAKGPNALE